MSQTAKLDPRTFEPPGPDSWVVDAVHVVRPFSRFQAEIHPPNLHAGFRETARRYGLLIDTLDWRFVNGFAYFAVRPNPVQRSFRAISSNRSRRRSRVPVRNRWAT